MALWIADSLSIRVSDLQVFYEMKKFLIILAASIAAIALLDFSFGKLCSWLVKNARGGNTLNEYYIAKQSSEDIIMLGSSRMRRHYNPKVFEDSLRMTCYNAGVNGNGIIFAYGLFSMITDRYSPKAIIYDLSVFDIDEDKNEKFLSRLRPYYNEPGIDSIFFRVESKERFKMVSNLYRYNTLWVGMLGDYFHPMRVYNKGYAPLRGDINYDPIPTVHKSSKIDPIRRYYLERIIIDCRERDIPLVMVISPHYLIESDNDYYDEIRSLCQDYSVQLWDYFEDPFFSTEKRYFNDQNHLNETGADAFSRVIASRLRHFFNANNGRMTDEE